MLKSGEDWIKMDEVLGVKVGSQIKVGFRLKAQMAEILGYNVKTSTGHMPKTVNDVATKFSGQIAIVEMYLRLKFQGSMMKK